jgi:hypothetical protein
MADAGALQDYGALALLGGVLVTVLGMGRTLLRSMLREHSRSRELLESVDSHLDVVTVELIRIRRELERRTEAPPSEVPHPQPIDTIPVRRKRPFRDD